MKIFRCIFITLISVMTMASCSAQQVGVVSSSLSDTISPSFSSESSKPADATVATSVEDIEAVIDKEIGSDPTISLPPFPDLPKADLKQYYSDPPDGPLFPAQDEETELFGYINDKGEWMIKPQFYYVGFFHGGLAGIELDNNNLSYKEYSKLSALINKDGEVVYKLPTGYAFSGMFAVLNGLIPIDTYAEGIDYTAFMDTSCGMVVPFSRWNQITMFQEGLMYHEASRGYLDTQGNLIMRIPEDADTADVYQEELAVTSIKAADLNRKYGFIDKEGKWAIKPVFDSACSFSDGVAAAMQNDKWGLIDKNGDWVLKPSYDEIITGEPGNNENRFTTMDNGKWGAIDNTGVWVIEPIYQSPLYFSEGLSIATLQTLEMEDTVYFNDWDRDPRNYGYIDRNGNWVIEPQYIAPSRFQNGLAYVTKHEAGSFTAGLIDHEGNWIWKYTPKNYLDLATIYNAFG